MKTNRVLPCLFLIPLALYAAPASESPSSASGGSLQSSITISASADKVWEALVTPALIKRWFLGVDTITDWKPGSSIVHKGEWQGKPYEDKGTIVEFTPGRRLIHTHWSAMSGKPDRPEHYQRVTYTLTPRGNATDLTIHEDNLPSPEAKRLSEETWKKVLQALKDVVEKPASS